MSTKQEIVCACGCGKRKMVRTADVNRGWGKFYSKSCKARQQSMSGKSKAYYQSKDRREHDQDDDGDFIAGYSQDIVEGWTGRSHDMGFEH